MIVAVTAPTGNVGGEVTSYLVGGDVTPLLCLRFVALALLGNVIGGSLFVAVLNNAHIRETR